MAAKEVKKVVLAYSGGLDTSIIIPWLKENYNMRRHMLFAHHAIEQLNEIRMLSLIHI